jgi:hypothetical protein
MKDGRALEQENMTIVLEQEDTTVALEQDWILWKHGITCVGHKNNSLCLDQKGTHTPTMSIRQQILSTPVFAHTMIPSFPLVRPL